MTMPGNDTPPIQTIIDGGRVRFIVMCVNAITLAPANPAELVFGWSVNGTKIAQYVYGVDAQVVNDTVGTFHVDLVTTGMTTASGRLSLLIGEFGTEDPTVQVVGFTTIQVEPAPIPLAFP